ncbi:MAG: hypothetical protein QOH72_5506 [Solirubrobacteraceae bacterium]|jgi:hypothetical protein|nr:hypothetical protein [Solirubrobacteraceae bacterium]
MPTTQQAIEAREWLAAKLTAGARMSTEVQAEAEEQGYSAKTLRTAREALGVVPVQRTVDGVRAFWWTLPPTLPPSTNGNGAIAPPPVFGARADQRPEWLPKTDLPWLEDYRHEHIDHSHAWQQAVDEIRQIQDRAAAAQATFRASVRRAFAAGEALPETPQEAQPLVVGEIIRAARLDAREAADALGACVVEVLAALRMRREEIDPYRSAFSAELITAIDNAPGGATALRSIQLRRELAELEGDTSTEGTPDDR